MTSEIWTWACTQVLRVCTFIFGSAISFLGVATVTLLVLIWVYTIIRLIVAPLIGRSIGGMIDTALYDTKRQVRSASKEFDKTSKEKQKMYYKK